MNKVDPMNKPFVDNKYRREAIDLQPYGNTISVETLADNPFESNAPIEIYTQQSGGMAGPDPKMQSRRGRRKVAKRIAPGHVAARQFNAPATSRAGFMPGLGLGDGAADAVAAGINAASGAVTSSFDAKAAAARAREAAARAREEEARTERARTNNMFEQSMFNMGQHGGIVMPLLMVGGAALVVAMVLRSKRKGRR
jgi:hypothetical protein